MPLLTKQGGKEKLNEMKSAQSTKENESRMVTAKKQAGVFALLANVASLKTDLTRWQKEKLVEDIRDAKLLTSSLTTYPGAIITDKKLIASWGNPHVPGEWLPICKVHPWAKKIINELLDTGEADVEEFHKTEMLRPIRWEVDQETGLIRNIYDIGEHAEKELLVRLSLLVHRGPLPFRRCALCKTIFVRHGKQKYCSKECTDKAIGSRNDYMKNYMAKKRAKKKRDAIKAAKLQRN
jgi:hypothetical protein